MNTPLLLLTPFVMCGGRLIPWKSARYGLVPVETFDLVNRTWHRRMR